MKRLHNCVDRTKYYSLKFKILKAAARQEIIGIRLGSRACTTGSILSSARLRLVNYAVHMLSRKMP